MEKTEYNINLKQLDWGYVLVVELVGEPKTSFAVPELEDALKIIRDFIETVISPEEK